METQDKIFNPLFAELFRIALPLLEGYQSDLGHDTLRLSAAVPGERYLWGVRKYGTEMRILEDMSLPRHSTQITETLRRFPEHRWYLLEIMSVRQDGYCTGTVTPLPAAEAAPPHDPLHHDLRDLHGYIKPVPPQPRDEQGRWKLGETVQHQPTPEQEAQAARLQELWREGDAPFSDGSRPSDPYVPDNAPDRDGWVEGPDGERR